jgi:endonuclease/exonuclease/phosphatase family metal-dependent hydrolase
MTTTLRIASYNILKGGDKRLGYTSKVINGMNPDICGVLEAVGWQDKKTYYKKFAKNLGYDFFDVAIANSKYNIAIFSKIPVKIITIKKGIRHVVLEAVIKNGPFKGLGIFFVHLSPVSEDARLLELKELLKYVSKLPSAIIMGDFNSLSVNDPYDKKNILKIFKKNNITKFGINKLRFDVIKKIESSEFLDVMKYLKNPLIATTGTPSNEDINHIAGLRIDYAFLAKNTLKYLRKAKVFKNSIAGKASDHYPLYIELRK